MQALRADSAPRPDGAREVALRAIRDVFGPSHRGAREALDYRARRAQLDARDRAFATELAYGAIKMRRLLDWYLAPYVGARKDDLPGPIAEVLRLGAYQLRLMGGVQPHAAVNESVSLARRVGHRGTAGLVNAVLRRLAEDGREPQPAEFSSPLDYLATRWSLPTWIVAHWERRFGDDVLQAIVEGVDAPALVSLRVDSRRLSREAALARLLEAGIAAHPSALAGDVVNLETGGPEGLIDAHDDWTLQSESAATAVDVLDPQPGETVIDLCSGRGNKTLALAQRMRDDGRIEAVELDARKCGVAREALAAAGLRSAIVLEGDARVPRETRADAVLLDAPCSGLGILGRHPEARWRKSPEDPERLAADQRAMLSAAAAAVRPGGRIVYSVCTTDVREGEEVVDALLAERPDVARAAFPARYAPYVRASGDVLIAPGIERRDGFFVAALTRRP